MIDTAQPVSGSLRGGYQFLTGNPQGKAGTLFGRVFVHLHSLKPELVDCLAKKGSYLKPNYLFKLYTPKKRYIPCFAYNVLSDWLE